MMKKQTYRITGLLYLLVIICAGFSQGFVRETIVIPGNAAATANNILEQEWLFRLGLSLDLVAFTLDAIIAILLYQMLKPFGKTLAMASSALRLIAHPAIASLNLVHHYMAGYVLENQDIVVAFGESGVEVISSLLMNAQKFGYLLAGALFGVHCVLLGIVIIKSRNIPRLFGWLLIASGAGYLIETYGNINWPGNEAITALMVGISAAIGEVSFTFYLLIKGHKSTPTIH